MFCFVICSLPSQIKLFREDFETPIYPNIYKKIFLSMEEVLDIIHKTIIATEFGGSKDKMDSHFKKTNTKIVVVESTCKSICEWGKTEYSPLARKIRAMSYD